MNSSTFIHTDEAVEQRLLGTDGGDENSQRPAADNEIEPDSTRKFPFAFQS